VQQNDPHIGEVYQQIKADAPCPAPDIVSDRSAETKTLYTQYERLKLSPSGVLYREYTSPCTGVSYQQRIVPSHLRGEITDELHRDLNGGHLGTRRSKALLQKNVFIGPVRLVIFT